tara:strand:- start:616 stop:2112 length:1497 start_codon:yes stop_codon:yes gene_type:complete
MINKVKSDTGKMVEREDCCKIKGRFYIKGDYKVKDSGECYLINGKWHRYNNGLISYDYESECYVLNTSILLKYGIVGMNKNGFIYGNYSSNPVKNVKVFLTELIIKDCISEEAIKGEFRERYSDGNFYRKNELSNSTYTNINKPPVDKNSLVYDSRFAMDLTIKRYNQYYEPSFKSQSIEELGALLEKYNITYGVEFETSKGYIPERLCYKHGLLPLRDGSIEGLEYVTIPLSGSKGLYNLYDICELLKKRCKYDFKCSMHLHLAGVKRKPMDIINFHKIMSIAQEEMFLLQPDYKKNATDYGKNKNYSAPMSKQRVNAFIKGTYDNKLYFKGLFEDISGGTSFSSYNNDLEIVHEHPQDPSGEHKWQIGARYSICNFTHILFGNKQTVEFRQHNNTFDFFKLFNFILTSASTVVFNNVYKKELLDFNFVKDIYESSDTLTYLMETLKSVEPLVTNDLYNINMQYNKDRYAMIKKMNVTDPEGLTEDSRNDMFKTINF